LLVASQGGHPGRTLIALAVIIAGLTGLMALSNNWTPKLGLDLRGGTTITLTAQNTSSRAELTAWESANRK
jgi:preprotein translocase subunit SecD